jgi:hypothetical protein
VAAGVVAALGASWLAFALKTPSGDALAIATFHEVCGNPERLPVQTGDLAELRRWAGQRRILLRTASAGPGDGVRVAGAAPLRDRPGIVVSYQSGGVWSALVIEPSGEAATKRIQRTMRDGFTIFHWRGRNQRYTLVAAEHDRPERACGLCHQDTPAGSV